MSEKKKVRILCYFGRHKWEDVPNVYPAERYCLHCGVVEIADFLGWIKTKKEIRRNAEGYYNE